MTPPATTRRFVVQRHTPGQPPGRSFAPHFDLMIEEGQALVTLQLRSAPDAAAEGVRSFDHRLRYLDYEGEVSGGRGRVAIWDRGELEDVEGTPRAPRYRARLRGARLRGLYELRDRPEPASEAVGVRWGPVPWSPGGMTGAVQG